MYLCIYLSIYLPTYLLSIYLSSIYLSIYLFIYLSTHPSIYLPYKWLYMYAILLLFKIMLPRFCSGLQTGLQMYGRRAEIKMAGSIAKILNKVSFWAPKKALVALSAAAVGFERNFALILINGCRVFAIRFSESSLDSFVAFWNLPPPLTPPVFFEIIHHRKDYSFYIWIVRLQQRISLFYRKIRGYCPFRIITQDTSYCLLLLLFWWRLTLSTVRQTLSAITQRRGQYAIGSLCTLHCALQ